MQDPPEKLMWLEQRWTKVLGGSASVELLDDVVYLAMSLRNVGSGIAVIHGWHPIAGLSRAPGPHVSPDVFRPQTRDLYIPPGDTSFWQGALRNPDEEEYWPIRKVVEARSAFTVDLLYGDHEGGQRAISRFTIVPREGSEETTAWLLSVSRHWNVDRPDPR
jgi:hypothetical protein